MSRSAAAVIVGVAAVTTWAVVAPKAQLDYWYDEIWRLDLLRRDDWTDIYRSEATPLPPLWFFGLRALLRPVYLAPPAVRAMGAAFVALAPAALAACSIAVLRRGRTAPAGVCLALAGGAATGMVMGGPFAGQIFSYLNQYGFEVGTTIAALTLCATADRRSPLPWPARIAIVLLPAATVGGLLLLPGLAAALLVRAWRAGEVRRRALLVVIGTFAASAATMLLTYLVMYRAVLERETSATAEFFAGERFTGGPNGVPGAVLRLLRGALESNAPVSSWPWLVLLTTIGAVLVARRQPVVFTALAISLPFCLLVSRLTGSPATVNRVNMPIILLVTLLFAIGVVGLISAIAGWLPPRLRWGATAAVGIVLAVWWWTPQDDEPPYRGLRGVTSDMAPIAASPYDHNVVVSYHWMTKWSAHDLLVNGGDGGPPHYAFLSEARDLSVEYIALDQPIYTDLEGLVHEVAGPEAAVWCVIPYDIGPEAAGRACRLDGSERRRVQVQRGERAEILLWEPQAGR